MKQAKQPNTQAASRSTPDDSHLPPANSRLASHIYSYGSAMLAATALIDKIKPHCEREPVIKGRLGEGRHKVKEIEIECVPKMQQVKRQNELYDQTVNQVICQLKDYYDLHPADGDTTLPVSRLPSAVSLNYMTIPTTIHFKEIEE